MKIQRLQKAGKQRVVKDMSLVSKLTKGSFLALLMLIGNSAYANKANDTVVWATGAHVDSADLYYSKLQESIAITLNMCDSLIYTDPETAEYKPLLAESYEQIDPLTLEVKLRKGVKFWNGKELDADDVAYTLRHISGKDSGVLTRKPVDWISSVEVVDPHTVRIISDEPTPTALAYLSVLTPIYPNHHYDDAPALSSGGGKDYGSVAPMCVGPYKLAELNPGTSLKIVKNDDYFEGSPKGKASIGNIIFKTIPDEDSQIAALMTNQLDWIWSVTPQNAELLSQSPGVDVKSSPTMRMSFLGINSYEDKKENPFKDAKVRKAIAHAIDRKAIVDNIMPPGSEVLMSICSPTQVGCDQDIPQYDYDPELAKKLLAEAGYPDGFKIPLYAYRDKQYSEAVAGYLKDVGIEADIQFMQFQAYASKIRSGDILLYHNTWGSYTLPDVALSVGNFFELGADDTTRDEKLSELLVKADHTLHPDERNALYKQALEIIADNAYYVPLFLYGRTYAMNSDLDMPVTIDELGHFYKASWK